MPPCRLGQQISEARDFSGLPKAAFEALQATLGSPGSALRNVAIPPTVVRARAFQLSACRESGRATTGTHRSSAGGFGWRLAKNVALCREMGALSSWRASTLWRQPSEGKARQHNRLEGQRRRQDRARQPVASSLSSLVDQGDDAGIGITPSKQVADWQQQYGVPARGLVGEYTSSGVRGGGLRRGAEDGPCSRRWCSRPPSPRS